MAIHEPRMTPVSLEGSGGAFINEVFNDPSRGAYIYLDDAIAGKAFYEIEVPQGYVGTPKLKCRIMANATTGNQRMRAGHVAIADGENWDGTYIYEAWQDIATPGTAYNIKDVTFPAAGNLTTTVPAVGETLRVVIERDGAHANDTLAVDTIMIHARFSFSDA